MKVYVLQSAPGDDPFNFEDVFATYEGAVAGAEKLAGAELESWRGQDGGEVWAAHAGITYAIRDCEVKS